MVHFVICMKEKYSNTEQSLWHAILKHTVFLPAPTSNPYIFIPFPSPSQPSPSPTSTSSFLHSPPSISPYCCNSQKQCLIKLYNNYYCYNLIFLLTLAIVPAGGSGRRESVRWSAGWWAGQRREGGRTKGWRRVGGRRECWRRVGGRRGRRWHLIHLIRC